MAVWSTLVAPALLFPFRPGTAAVRLIERDVASRFAGIWAVLVLVAAEGIAQILVGPSPALGWLPSLITVLGALGAIAALVALVTGAGRVLGGSGTYGGVGAALVGGSLPFMGLGLAMQLWAGLGPGPLPVPAIHLALAGIGWSLVAQWIALANVHRISMGRAAACLATSWLAMFAVLATAGVLRGVAAP